MWYWDGPKRASVPGDSFFFSSVFLKVAQQLQKMV
jgi:hypothetical protein